MLMYLLLVPLLLQQKVRAHVPSWIHPPMNHGPLISVDPSLPNDMDMDMNNNNNNNSVENHLEERKKLYQSHRRHLVAETCSTGSTTVAAGSNFSLGGAGSSYANTQSCTWIIKGGVASGGTIGVAFTFFHTEEKEDTVKVYDADDTADPPTPIGDIVYSGDELTPFIIAKDGVRRLKVVFTANEAVAQSSRTLQLGFTAQVFDAGTSCFSDSTCSGHGICSAAEAGKARKCVCTPLSSSTDKSDVYFGDDCSVKVAHIDVDAPVSITSLKKGDWSYYWTEVAANTKYLVDFKDTGLPDSDPLLVLGSASTFDSDVWSPILPRLSSKTRYYEDYLSWFYDRSDIHYIHFRKQPNFQGNRAIMAVYNHIARAISDVQGTLTLRSSTTSAWPCVLDCSGHGTCGGRGQCTCTDPWYGNGWRAPDTCEYEMKDITAHLDEKIGTASDAWPSDLDELRVGAWAYFKLTVNPNWVGQRTIAVDFTSLSPHAQPLVVIKKGSVPRLKYGYLPTYDAFDFDYGDKNGFELLQGQRQNIIIPPSDLGTYTGNYYIGIYDIWGHTALPQESHDSVKYALYVNKYAAGTPCPKDSENLFCAGHKCDFNTGKCDCPPNALGLDCSMVADKLDAITGDYVERPAGLAVKSTEYFYVSVSRGEANSQKNLVVDLVKLKPTESSFPVLLARRGDIPFGTDRSLFDDHDYVSRYHESEAHRILLDHAELEDHGESVWYFAVVNEEDPNSSEDPLTYKIRARFMYSVECLTDDPPKVCSGHGTCDKTLGRCTCTEKYTGDDCGDAGVYSLSINPTTRIAEADNTQKPSIPVDGWVYYSLSVGCNTTLRVDFTTTSDGSRPLLVMEKDRLPLMVDSTHEYDDYYSGVKLFGHTQSIRIAPCDTDVNIGGQLRCYIHPLFPGTDWKTGSPEPGEWYIGIFNDPNVGGTNQPASIVDYTLQVTQQTTCSTESAPCAPGFRNEEQQCQIACPGMHPEKNEIFSNVHMDVPAPCDGHGECSADGAKCTCSPAHYGDDCSITCPSDSSNSVCSGHGTCDDGASVSTGTKPTCTCAAGFGGTKCDITCPSDCSGHGSCDAVQGVPLCKCAVGYAGSQCNFKCKTGSDGSTPCSGHGKCASRQTSETTKEDGFCQCDATHTGDDCSSSCPMGIDNAPCSGSSRGTCSFVDQKGSCACHEGFAGLACESYSGCPDACSGHGKCVGDIVSEKYCTCQSGWVGPACSLQCPVTSVTGEICEGKGTCSALDGVPICTCEPTRVGKVCELICPMGDGAGSDADADADADASAARNSGNASATPCNGQGTCVIDDKTEGATCACLDGYGGVSCSAPALTEKEALEQVQSKVDTRSITIASIVSVVSILFIAIVVVVYRRTRSRLRQYEVTFGTDALLGPMNSGERTVVAGRSVRRTSREGSESLAAEDVLARGAMAVQMQEIVVKEGEADI